MTLCFTVREVTGPLFVLDEVDGIAATVTQRHEHVAVLRTHYAQFEKRYHGWRLAIEELAYLRATAPVHALRVDVLGDAAAAQWTLLRVTCAVSCSLYAALTDAHAYRLRHGSQYGALFIGYHDTRAHGEHLFFLGPLDARAQVRAARVANTVSKRAFVCMWRDDNLVLRDLAPRLLRAPVTMAATTTVAHTRRKRRRGDDGAHADVSCTSQPPR